ncbi:MAG: class I SAM-dependent methyltransferase [Bryobacterales bacterium]|nr:class I SAM-dependent methyltransferase [Bryobacterales bacterium]
MSYEPLRRRVPKWLDRYLWFFENAIEDAVLGLAGSLPAGARVLDAGAGEGKYKHLFGSARYTGLDLAVGDQQWDYAGLDVLGDLTRLPFGDGTFDACLSVVTLEHVREPAAVVAEMGRTLKRGGRLLLVVPQDWEVHQAPHDYFRYTRYGVRHLLEQGGFSEIVVESGGGYFRLMGRRMLNGLQFFKGVAMVPGALLLLPGGLLFPLLDGLDRERNFTLGYLCTAIKR